MPARFTANLYWLRIRKIRIKEWEPTMYKGAWDVFSMVNGYLAARHNVLRNMSDLCTTTAAKKREYRTLRITRHAKNVSDRTFSAIVESGEYGTERPIVDTHTGNDAYRTRSRDADHHPHFFYLSIPDNATRYPFVLGRVGARVPRSSLLRDMQAYFAPLNLIVEISEIVDSKILKEHLTSGVLRRVAMRRRKKSNDPNTLINGLRIKSEPLEDGDEVRLELRSNRLTQLVPRIKDVLSGHRTASELIEIQGVREWDDVFIDIERNGITHRFNLSHPDTAGASFELEGVPLDSDGYPRYNAWLDFAATIVESYDLED